MLLQTKKVQEGYINFLRGMFKERSLTKYIQLAFLDRNFTCEKEISQSALNNFKLYSMVGAGPLASLYRFYRGRGKNACEQYHRDFEEVKRWYDGYQLGKLSCVQSECSGQPDGGWRISELLVWYCLL